MEHLSHNVESVSQVISPAEMIKKFPLPGGLMGQTIHFRKEIAKIITGKDPRKIVILGPCSVHDPVAGLEYAQYIRNLQKVVPHLLLVMRVYFEKPRTTTGWKGFINDPELNGTFQIAKGLTTARQFLIEVANLGVPTATEFLDPVTPKYFRHLFSWGAIGARTMESQVHRELASGLPMPVGFKNSTSGHSMLIANSIKSANSPHSYLGIDDDAKLATLNSKGNPYAHTVLRGTASGPNYDESSINHVSQILRSQQVNDSIIVDCSHANCGGDYRRQVDIARSVMSRACNGLDNIKGVMVESFLEEGKQDLHDTELVFGKSITDACIGMDVTTTLVVFLNERLSYHIRGEKVDDAES